MNENITIPVALFRQMERAIRDAECLQRVFLQTLTDGHERGCLLLETVAAIDRFCAQIFPLETELRLKDELRHTQQACYSLSIDPLFPHSTEKWTDEQRQAYDACWHAMQAVREFYGLGEG